MARLSALYDNEPSPILDVIWSEALAHIEPARLATLFRKLETSFVPTMACPFPVPAHVVNLLAEEKTIERARRGEAAWQAALAEIATKYHPQLGWRGNLPEEDILAAIRAAGGIAHLWGAPDDRLVWAKKEFLEAYLRDLP